MNLMAHAVLFDLIDCLIALWEAPSGHAIGAREFWTFVSFVRWQ